jgi:hypothetical protein
MRIRTVVAAAVLGFWGGSAPGHEFWIDPTSFVVAPGEVIEANLRVGENLGGASYSYVPRNFTRFDLVTGQTVTAVPGRAGDTPAMTMPAPDEGLAVVVHVTRDYSLTYTEWEKFLNFTRHKDFAWAVEEHRARGLPEVKFKELYSRHAKSLIAVGAGAGADREMGLETEIVALANPYTDDLSGGFPVRVLYRGAPRADAQVELFERDNASGAVAVRLYRTDAEGVAVLEVSPGHGYLADHVVMRALEPAAPEDPVWESLWASLTFGVGGLQK